MKSPVQHGLMNRDARFGHKQIPATKEIEITVQCRVKLKATISQ